MKRFSTRAIGAQQGSRILFSDFADGGQMWAGRGQREVRHTIRFDEAFADLPVVSLSISMWDMDRDSNARGDLSAENVTEAGFELVFKTWGDTRIARLRTEWLAIGSIRDDDNWDVD